MTSTTAPLVRTTDPDTSREAAASTRHNRTRVREGVYEAIRAALRPVTHDEIIRYYRQCVTDCRWPAATDSSIRTRCHELVVQGVVEVVDGEYGTSPTGRRARLWRLVDA